METITTNTKDPGRKMRHLTWDETITAIKLMVSQAREEVDLEDDWDMDNIDGDCFRPLKIYGVPRGGVYVASMVKALFLKDVLVMKSPENADIIFDDIVDSGATKKQYKDKHNKPFFDLVSCLTDIKKGEWIVFPWEGLQDETAPTENVRRILEFIGDDPKREGLLETPDRVVKSWGRLYGGYHKKVEDVLKVFKDDSSDEMVILKNIEFYSTCEHHMQPFFGVAHIAYIPNGKVIGISKLARILEIFARRLQIQERLTSQISEALMEHLEPLGAACMIEAKHFCMVARGVEKQSSVMVTSSLLGDFKTDPATRQEFLSLIKGA